MNKLDDYINAITEKTVYECTICDTEYYNYDDAERCVRECYAERPACNYINLKVEE